MLGKPVAIVSAEGAPSAIESIRRTSRASGEMSVFRGIGSLWVFGAGGPALRLVDHPRGNGAERADESVAG